MTDNERKEKLKYLILCLEYENPRYKNYEAPDDPDEAFNLYRALCNVRMPEGPTGHTLPEQFYRVQSEVLNGLTEKKGITDASSLPSVLSDQRISLWQGDITALKCDAIVNAANSQMPGCFSALHAALIMRY